MRWARLGVTVLVAVLVAAGGAAWAVAATAPEVVATGGGRTLVRTHEGLLLSDPFTEALPQRDIEDTYEMNGSATPGVGSVDVTSSGLVVSVAQHPPRFEGWFAVTRRAFPRAGVYHVRMAKPAGNVSVSGGEGEAVFAVQTGTTPRSGLINYVVVGSASLAGVTSWSVGYAHGHIADAALDTLVQTPPSATAPSGEEITLQTDGSRSLSVYFGSRLVFSSNRLDMDIEPPYQPYLEVQARGISYQSRFTDFWITESPDLTVAGLSPGAQVVLVGLDGQTLAASRASGSRSGEAVATLRLPLPSARGRGYLLVGEGAHRVRLGPFSYSGGDAYGLR